MIRTEIGAMVVLMFQVDDRSVGKGGPRDQCRISMERPVRRTVPSFRMVAAAAPFRAYSSKVLTQRRRLRAYARAMTTSPSRIDPSAAPLAPEEALDVRRACGFLLREWRMVGGSTLLALACGAAYVLCAPPTYSASILVRVESERVARLLAPETAGLEQKPEANDEMEVLRSRLVLGAAVDETHADIEAWPLRTPLIGAALARAQARVAALGIGDAAPAPRVDVTAFDVPEALEEERFVLTVGVGGRYTLTGPGAAAPLAGKVGVPLRARIGGAGGGALALAVASLDAPEGERFALVRHNRLEAIETLQRKLDIELRGKQSNLIGAALEGSDPVRVAATMGAIARAYLRHNGASRAGEAARRAGAVEAELPRLQQELEAAESRYNAVRHSHGTIDSQEETKTLLQRSVLAQERIETLRQQRGQLAARFTPEHPEMAAVADQLRGAEAQLAEIKAAMGRIPKVEQDVMGLARDLKVRTDAFAAMLAAAQTLRIESASPLASVRLIDGAEVPAKPVRPRALAALPIAAAIGLVAGVLAAWLRQALSNRVADPFALEQQLGLPFSALVPHAGKSDAVGDSMRRFAAVLGPAMRGAPNKVVMISGAAARAGASFVAEHLAAALAASGSRVLLVDGDLRGGQRAARFQLAPGPGLAGLVRGEATVDEAILQSVRERLDILPAGEASAAAAGLAGQPALGELLAAFARDYDVVLVDTAPALVDADALALGRHAGAVFAVVRAGVSTVDEVGETARLFGQAGVPLAGFVFNDAETRWLPHRYRARPQPLIALAAQAALERTS
jgi:tyrosine-protein kinase Etk/Wzc